MYKCNGGITKGKKPTSIQNGGVLRGLLRNQLARGKMAANAIASAAHFTNQSFALRRTTIAQIGAGFLVAFSTPRFLFDQR
jgi:hypothetical protein